MDHKEYLKKTLKDLKKILDEKRNKFEFVQKLYEEERNEHQKLLSLLQVTKGPIQLELLTKKLQDFNSFIMLYTQNLKKLQNKDFLFEVEKDLYQNSLDFAQMKKMSKNKNFDDLIRQREYLLKELYSTRAKFDSLEEMFNNRIDYKRHEIRKFQEVSKSAKDFLSDSSDLNQLLIIHSKKKSCLKKLEKDLDSIEEQIKSYE